MLLKITNISGLFLLCYLAVHMDKWNLSIHKTNFLSPYIVSFIHYIPPVLILILLTLLFFLYIISIVSNVGVYPIYFVSILLFHILIKISINTLMLEDTTTFVFFEVHHHIPLEWKIHHFENSLLNNIELYKPEILNDAKHKATFMKVNLDITKIQDLNAIQIADYANQIFNQQLANQDTKISSYMKVLFYLTSFSSIIYIFSENITNLLHEILSSFN